MVARKTHRIEISIHEKFVRRVGLLTKVRNYVNGEYLLGPLFSTFAYKCTVIPLIFRIVFAIVDAFTTLGHEFFSL